MENKGLKLYIKVPETNDINEFVLSIFREMTPALINMNSTYYDKECIKLHCNQGKLRSFDDIYTVINTKFPKVKPEEVLAILIKQKMYNTKGERVYPQLAACGSMDRIRFLYTSETLSAWEPYWGIKYKSEWSWSELLHKLEITDEKSYIKFVE